VCYIYMCGFMSLVYVRGSEKYGAGNAISECAGGWKLFGAHSPARALLIDPAGKYKS